MGLLDSILGYDRAKEKQRELDFQRNMQPLYAKATQRANTRLNSGQITRNERDSLVSRIIQENTPKARLNTFDRANLAMANKASNNFITRNFITGAAQLSPTKLVGNVVGYAGRAGSAFGWDNGKYLAQAGDNVAGYTNVDQQGGFRSRGLGDDLVRGGIELVGDAVNPVTRVLAPIKYGTQSANNLARGMEQTGRYSPMQSFAAGTGLGAVSAALERTGLNKITGGAGTRAISRVASAGITEGLTEGAQQFTQNLANNRFIDRNQSLVQGVPQSIAAGAILGGGVRGSIELNTPKGLNEAQLAERNKWVNIFTTAKDKGKQASMDFAARKIDAIDMQGTSPVNKAVSKFVKPVSAFDESKYTGAIGKDVPNPNYVPPVVEAPQVGKTDPVKKAEIDTNIGLEQLSDIRKQYASDKEFFDKVILENQEAKGKIGDFARHIASRDAREGSIYNKNYLTEILDDELAPINSKMDKAIYEGQKNMDLKRDIQDLERSTGQEGLFQKVAQEMKGMTEAESNAYMMKAMKSMRDNGVLAMDFINRQNGYTPKASAKPTIQDALEGKSTKLSVIAPLKPKTKTVTAPSGLKVEERYVTDYAKTLKEMDSGKGGQMIETPDGYKRVTEHSPFYSNFYKENKRKPTDQDWIAEAKRQVESGEAGADFYDYVASDVEALGNNKVNAPSTRMSVAEKESLFQTVPQGTDKQIKVRTPNDAKTVKVNKLVAKNEELPTIDTNRVSNADKAFRSTRSIIERQGENGKELASGLQKARDTQELYLADLQKQMPSVTKLARKGKNSLTNKDFENFVDATQGLAEPKNELVAQAINEWQATHPAIRQRAVDAGLEVGDLGSTYYPHFIDYDEVFKNKNTYNQSLNHLVKTGQAKNVEEAIKLLGYARDVSRNRQFGNLEASRLIDLPFYDKTPNSLISYLNGSTKRIAQTETFGKGDEKALKLIADAGQQGFDTEAMKNAYDVAVGAKQYNQTASKISGGIRKYVTTTRLGLGALTNVSQNVNTGIVTGHLRTLGAMAKQFDPKVREFARDTGVISDALLNDLKTQQGYSSFTSKVLGKGVNKITAPFFGTVEKFNRAVAATAGRDYALRLAQKGDVSTLQKLGVTGKIGKELTEAQQIQAARKIVEKTQFKVDAQDLPGWADSPGGKLVSQFRTFSYNQGKFFSNEILKKAAKGDVMPLARLMAALPLGYALYETKRVIAGRPEEEDKKKQALSVFQNIGGAGLVFDLYQSLNPIGSKYIPSDRRASMAVGAFGGPAVGVATQGIGALSEAIQRKNTPKDASRLDGKLAVANTGEDYTDLTSLARFGLQQIPVVGTPIKNRLLPFKQEAEADAGKSRDGIAITDATTKDGNEYATRDKYDAIINAYTKSDNLVSGQSITESKLGNVQKYDNKELKGSIETVANEASDYLKSKGITGVKADSKLAVLYAKMMKSEAQDPEKAFFTALGKAYPGTKEQAKTTSKKTTAKKSSKKSTGRKSSARKKYSFDLPSSFSLLPTGTGSIGAVSNLLKNARVDYKA